MREVVSEAENPVMLDSVGKDSAVMLHLAKKAFYPSSPPFPLMHVDTTWKFQEMYKLRDKAAKDAGMELLVHQNPEAKEKGINPFDQWGVELGKVIAGQMQTVLSGGDSDVEMDPATLAAAEVWRAANAD